METVIDHTIEPALAGPLPRRAGLPLGTNLLLLAAAMLFALFIYGGGRALVEAVKLVWLGAAGRTVSARVAAVQTEPSPIRGQPATQVGLRYSYIDPFAAGVVVRQGLARLDVREAADAERLHDVSPVPSGRKAPVPVPTFRVGDVIPLRCAVWLGHTLVYPWQGAPTGKTVFLLLCGGLVIAFSALLLRRLVRWRAHRLRLLRHGVATVGTVVHKEARAEDSPRYFVRYGYAVGVAPREHEEQVSIEQWKGLEIGQPVTVLYDPERVEDAGLYVLLGKG